MKSRIDKEINAIPMYKCVDFYQYFIRYVKGTKYDTLDKKTHEDICIKANQETMNQILSKNKDFKIPFGIGGIGLRKIQFDSTIKRNFFLKYFVDKKLTKEINGWMDNPKPIYNLHDETSAYIPMIRYLKKGIGSCNRSFYSIRFNIEWYARIRELFFSRKIDLNIMTIKDKKHVKSS